MKNQGKQLILLRLMRCYILLLIYHRYSFRAVIHFLNKVWLMAFKLWVMQNSY